MISTQNQLSISDASRGMRVQRLIRIAGVLTALGFAVGTKGNLSWVLIAALVLEVFLADLKNLKLRRMLKICEEQLRTADHAAAGGGRSA